MTDLIKKVQTLVGAEPDGIIGSKTLGAIAEALDITPSSYNKSTIKNIQVALGVSNDGIVGKNTLNALISALSSLTANKKEVKPDLKKYIEKPIKFTKVNYKVQPVTQKALRTGTTIFGKAGCENDLVKVTVPENYPLYYGDTRVKTIRIHKLVADRLEAALKDIIEHYGDDIEIVAPAICKYDGSYNFRKSRNGTSQSIHSWGLAIDFDAENNTMKMSAPKARLSQDIYKPFFDIMEHHGFLSLGRRRGV